MNDLLPIKLSANAVSLLRCPICQGNLRVSDKGCICLRSTCGESYPVVRGVPILFSNQGSVLSYRNDYNNNPTIWRKIRQIVKKNIPVLILNVGGGHAIGRVIEALSERTQSPVILNIGEIHVEPIIGPVLVAIRQVDNATVIEADCALGPGANLIIDWSVIPLLSGTVDAVVIDTGLEHVQYPHKVILEVHRVLKDDGLIYVDMPFMMPVHAGAKDFSRLSSAGLRGLLHDFEEIERGISFGPAVALSNMLEYFLVGLTLRKSARFLIRATCRLTLFWIKYIDLLLVHQLGAMDAAGGTYFVGRKSRKRATHDEITASYLGAVTSMYEPLNRK